MRKLEKRAYHRWTAVLVAVILAFTMAPAALADTDDHTPKITQQPDQLVLQLGVRWAGVEFELRTDAGIFPAPVVVDETGVLRMDLGGSTTYTLSCIESTVPIPDPQEIQELAPEVELPVDETPVDEPPVQPSQIQPEPVQKSLSVWPLVVFLMGMAAAGGALIAMQVSKRRQQSSYEEWDEDEDTM